jgi:hypothetical protein
MGFEILEAGFGALEIGFEALEMGFLETALETGFEAGHDRQDLRRVMASRV